MSIIFSLISLLLTAFSFLILARVLLSYFPNVDPYNPWVRMTYQLTEPVLEPIRRALPQTGMIDFSPMIVLIGIYVIRVVIGV